jgi:hypothetical protein
MLSSDRRLASDVTQGAESPTWPIVEEVRVKEGGRPVSYYQWLATDIGFPLKLARKDGSWMVEYRRVRIGRVSDFLFQLPVNFQPLEKFDGPKEKGPPEATPDAKM